MLASRAHPLVFLAIFRSMNRPWHTCYPILRTHVIVLKKSWNLSYKEPRRRLFKFGPVPSNGTKTLPPHFLLRSRVTLPGPGSIFRGVSLEYRTLCRQFQQCRATLREKWLRAFLAHQIAFPWYARARLTRHIIHPRWVIPRIIRRQWVRMQWASRVILT